MLVPGRPETHLIISLVTNTFTKLDRSEHCLTDEKLGTVEIQSVVVRYKTNQKDEWNFNLYVQRNLNRKFYHSFTKPWLDNM